MNKEVLNTFDNQWKNNIFMNNLMKNMYEQ